MMKRHGKRDGNHAEIRDGLRQLGFLVADTGDVGGGFPDLVVARGGIIRLVEVKTANGCLTAEQVAFHRLWQDAVIVAQSIDDVLESFGVAL